MSTKSATVTKNATAFIPGVAPEMASKFPPGFDYARMCRIDDRRGIYRKVVVGPDGKPSVNDAVWSTRHHFTKHLPGGWTLVGMTDDELAAACHAQGLAAPK